MKKNLKSFKSKYFVSSTVIISLVVIFSFTSNCSKEDDCQCEKTTITYDRQNIPIRSTSLIPCSEGYGSGVTHYEYDVYNRVIQEIYCP